MRVTSGERKTKLIRLGNIEFWGLNHERIDLWDKRIYQARAVSITFEDQKNGEKMDRNTQPSPFQ